MNADYQSGHSDQTQLINKMKKEITYMYSLLMKSTNLNADKDKELNK